ncbi:ankyrin [Lentinus tigrinus ALCF2SS1-7]|uniref:Ankyrin n=1 Tax=Lentinus tigrinus ALCF2SS1-6 TaxID=1328759 RepID=A0A5C2SCV2_9APHY|nr:ankyrin [Lentinus tigrinus ALCF2SS1-6]RPD75186.1 ankyrin [Lentinus tigrinus ALCF2SS1-7]
MATHSRGRRRTERAALDAALLDAAARADEHGVQIALARGADVNAVDVATDSTVVTCAIAGDSSWEDVDVSDASFGLQSRVEVLRTVIRNDSMSFYALNAPTRGVTPLGLAAWLNVPDVVRVLLEESRGLVAVDGTDAVGVTPLMYAARDGAVEAASILLANGARPDLRDTHHRTAIHYALRHPRLLWLLESTLRRQRVREFTTSNRRQLHPLPEPHAAYAQAFSTSSIELSNWPAPSDAILSRSTAALSRAIAGGDLPSIYQALFPATQRTTVLVNRLDSHGWGPLHYCVCAPNPSVEVLDALFLAGADTSLYTSSKHGTPLHCLARKAQHPANPLQAARLHVFIHHLVRELRAPLSATDENGETCIHVAAERGHSMEVLLAFLACDTRNTVREMKNSRGLTALEVARPELRIAFGPDAEPRRSNSVASFRTIRPSTSSSTSTSSYASSMTVPVSNRPQFNSFSRLESPLENVDTSLLPRRILENLIKITQEAPTADALEISDLRDVLDETAHLGEVWVHNTQNRIREAAQDLRDARGRFNEVDNLLETVTQDLEGVYGPRFSDRRDSTERARRRTTDSGDSDLTAVSSSSLSRKWRSMSDLRSSNEMGRRELSDVPELPRLIIAEEDDSADSSTDKPSSFLNALLSPTTRELLHKSSKLSIDSGRTASPAPSKLQKDGSSSSTAKLKAWFRKKLRFEIPDTPCETKIVVPGEQSPRRSPYSPVGDRNSSEELLCTARRIVRTAGQDLSCIEGCMDEADEYLSLASRFLSQADRRLKMNILNRQAALESARLAQLQDQLDDPFMSAIASTLRSATDAVPFPLSHSRSGSDSDTSLGSLSPGSSVASLSDTLIESEDDDTRVLRRLMTRKIEARTDGAFDEVDKVLTWLRIVQDTLRSLRRRTNASMTITLP